MEITTNNDAGGKVTIEMLEAIASQMEQSDYETRQKLQRLIRAYARILSQRESDKFEARATEYSDEDGHYDNSYPPDQAYKDRSGPRLYKVAGFRYDEIATEGGFYYSWRAATTYAGLYVSRSGDIYGCAASGTGDFGQFAAHPGNCNVMLSLEWEERDLDEVTTEELSVVEEDLRKLAFPHVAARLQQ